MLLTTLLLSAAPAPVPDDLFVCSFQPATVARHDAASGVLEQALDPGPLAGALGAARGPDGALYVCSEGSDQVLRYHALSGAYLGAFSGDDPNTSVDESGGLETPAGIAFGPDGAAYVAAFGLNAVLRYDGSTGAFMDVFVQPNEGNLAGADAGLAFGPGGDLYVPSYWNNRVKRFDGASGTFVENFLKPTDSPLDNARQIVFGADGFAYGVSEGSDQVLRYDAPSGAFAGVFADTASGGGLLPTFLLFRPTAGATCAGAPHSMGPGALLAAHGSTSLAAGELLLAVAGAPPGEWATLVFGPSAASLPAGDGLLCVGGTLFRADARALDGQGAAGWTLDPGASGAPFLPGSTWHFQVAFRDAGGATGFNFSAALRAAFAP